MAQRNKKSKVPGISDDVLKSFVLLHYHNELSSHSRPSILGFSQGSVGSLPQVCLDRMTPNKGLMLVVRFFKCLLRVYV